MFSYTSSVYRYGGVGGGLTGGNSSSVKYGTIATGGTQTAGGVGALSGTHYNIVYAGFGIGQNGVRDENGLVGGGGGGWYGGGAQVGGNGVEVPGGGGSSYIGGVTNGTTTSGVNAGNGKIIITY